MTSQPEALTQAIASRDETQIRPLILGHEFILIRVREEEDEVDDDENVGALTATVEEDDVLVAFTSEEAAGKFVSAMGQELFEEGEEIDGFMVDGKTLLEYLPENFGLLINPENEHTAVIDAALATELTASNE